tara:strand:+ start:3017 stop:3520 length:504 start_codon:yes stop_codon:yes gene_type:complete
MKEILLSLICQEYDVEESYIMSTSRDDIIQEPLAMMSYILAIDYGITVVHIHEFYKSKGFPKQRQTVYGQIRRAQKNFRRSSAYNDMKSSLIHGLEMALNTGIIELNEDIYAIRGRVVHKLMALDDSRVLGKVERQLNSYLKTEFIKKGQFEENKKEAWVTTYKHTD